jgi:hypothetical protein
MNYVFILTVITKVETWVPHFNLKINCYSSTQKYADFSQPKKFHILEKMLITVFWDADSVILQTVFLRTLTLRKQLPSHTAGGASFSFASGLITSHK